MTQLVKNLDTKKQNLKKLLQDMITARVVDEVEQEYTARGEAFFHVAGSGHEGMAVLYPHLISEDYLHTHYRDKSLLIAKGVTAYEYFLALFNKGEGHSCGRQMNAHMSAKEFNILSLAGPVGNSSPQAAGVAGHLKDMYERKGDKSLLQPLVMCSQGEGTTHQGEFLEGLLLSVRDNLPMLWVIEDNKFAISTKTEGKTFYQMGNVEVDNFAGCPITRVDGRHPQNAYDVFEQAVHNIRTECKPQIVVFSVDRLSSHTNADDHRVYRSSEDIQSLVEKGDPIVNLIMYLDSCDYESAKKQFDELCDKTRVELRKEAARAQSSVEPKPIFSAKPPLPKAVSERAKEPYEEGDLSMLEAMRTVLHEQLKTDERVFLYGQDIEDPKGDVFGLTKGLSTEFTGRVVNSPLSESLIVGASIGRALAGAKPVAFLQFADFFPPAFNQVISDLGTMYWRTNGSWQAPVIVFTTCGGYRPGLGPFHASVMESICSHVPGVDVHMPSTAADAAGLLNAAFLAERPSIFFYPKTQLNAKVEAISADSAKKYVVVPGKAKLIEEGNDISFVAYGNTVPLCLKAAKSLKEVGIESDVIDIRTMSPLDDESIRKSVLKTKRLLVSHEDNRTSSMSSEIIARIVEQQNADEQAVLMRRVVKSDVYVPCNFENQLAILPSYKSILETAVDMLGGSITWKKSEKDEDGFTDIKAVGASPSDEQLNIVKWLIKEGDTITKGDLIAEGEADKAVCDVNASVSGTVDSFFVEEGDTVDIGKPIVRIKTEGVGDSVKTVTREDAGVPQIILSPLQKGITSTRQDIDVSISHVNTVLGSRVVDNKELVEMSPEWTEDKIVNSIGVKSRHWIGKEQSLVSMACEAAIKTLKEANLSLADISGIVCATGTHTYQTPSLAAMVQYHLVNEVFADDVRLKNYNGYAFDLSAACAGFLFAVNDCYNRVKLNKNEKILMLTGEVLSTRVDMSDYGTAPVFSDAASAMLICDSSSIDTPNKGIIKSQPILKTVGEPAKDLTVPEQGNISMNGVEVYKVAVANLTQVAQQVCDEHGLSVDDIDLIVPHQANIKIISGIARRLKTSLEKFYINIDKHGNSSSNTVPICLNELAKKNLLKGKKVLVAVFGGGYTFAGALFQY